ncbi:MAG: TetR/AcrR family transcriptional regulator [Parvibaculum sp.]|nr:TetR/AcrR family transcriptional regulator [Parvibaculum sp.]|tara:strand:+ start:3101 stop:3697 length:597 start_codon:yes stop_codon:yes gene_type:complete
MSKIGKSERTHNEILDAAWGLIAEHGADISLSQIAAAVGVTRQSIYVHFGSRGGLLVALVRRADERADIEQKFERALAIETAEARLAAFLDVWFRFVPEIYPVAKDLVRLKANDEEAFTAWEDRMTDLRRAFGVLTKSLKADHALATHWTAPRAAEFMWASSSIENWGLLTVDCGWTANQAANAIKQSLDRAILARRA